MKTLRTTLTPVLLALGVFSLSSAARAGGPPIVGLWQDHYTSDYGAPPFKTYQQFHTDGVEIETPDFAPGVCMGTWKQIGERTIRIFHVGFTPGGGPGGSVRFELREEDTVSTDRNSFDGWYDQKFFGAAGNLVFEDKGAIHGTRLSVDQF